jgi:hypothetical protein
MTDGVDPSVQAIEATHPHSLLNRPLPHPEPFQLPTRHHPMLPIGQLADSDIESTRLL